MSSRKKIPETPNGVLVAMIRDALPQLTIQELELIDISVMAQFHERDPDFFEFDDSTDSTLDSFEGDDFTDKE